MGRKGTNNRTCIKCGKTKALTSNFYTSKSMNAVDGRVMICKTCINEMVDEHDLESVKKVLRELNIPFIDKYWLSAKKSKQATFGAYIKQINSFHQTQDLEYEDSTSKKGQVIDFDFEDEDDEEFEVTRSMVKFWGKGLTRNDYLFLEEFYDDYTKIYATDTPAQINIYKNIAKTQLLANKELEEGNIANYDKLMKTVSALHNDGNIKPIQESGNNEDTLGVMGLWIKKIEETEPIPEAAEEFQDVDGIGKYIREFFTEHMKKILGISSGADSDG